MCECWVKSELCSAAQPEGGHRATGQNTSKMVQSHQLLPISFQELQPAAPHKAAFPQRCWCYWFLTIHPRAGWSLRCITLQWRVFPAFHEWLCRLSLQPALSRCFIADHLLIWHAPKHSPFGSQDPHFGWKPNCSPLSLDSHNCFWGTYMQRGNALLSPTETERWGQIVTAQTHSSIIEISIFLRGNPGLWSTEKGLRKTETTYPLWELRYMKHKKKQKL